MKKANLSVGLAIMMLVLTGTMDHTLRLTSATTFETASSVRSPGSPHGDFDMMVGSFGNIVRGYRNDGGLTNPLWVREPSWDTPVIPHDPEAVDRASPCIADLDGDGDYDMLISNARYDYPPMGYNNTGTRTEPEWTYCSAWNVLDLNGYEQNPYLADFDGDGDYDLVVGNEADHTACFFENSGSSQFPKWERRDSFEFSPGVEWPSPVVKDLDLNGKWDFFFGSYTNDRCVGWEMTGVWWTNPVWTRRSEWDVIGLQSNCHKKPDLVDLNGDGKLEAMIGVGDPWRNVTAYENTGSVTNPQWTRKPSFDIPFSESGWIRPAFADMDADGQEMIDQSCTNCTGYREILASERVGQTFKPCSTPLVAVDIYLKTLNPDLKDTINVTIHVGGLDGAVIASASRTIDAGWNGFTHFDLGTTTVMPDATYAIEVNATTNLFGWASNTPDYYLKGEAIIQGTHVLNTDFSFRTYTCAPDAVWKYVVTEHRERRPGDMFEGDFFTFPFPPCCTGPKEIGFDTSYLSMLIDMEDFDNDGDFDYLVMKAYLEGAVPQIWFLLYNNTGDLNFTKTWQKGPITLDPSLTLWELGIIGLTAADFNNDGWPDFVATIPKPGEYTDEIHFYRNDKGDFTDVGHIVVEWAMHARDMDAGDFNLDGKKDFVIFEYPHGADGNFKLYWYENTGAWNFVPHSIGLTPSSIAMIVAGDFGAPNHKPADGRIDFIVGQDDDGDPGQAWIYFNKPSGGFDGPYEAYDLEPGIEAGSDQPGSGLADALDCDNDGLFDVVATSSKADPLRSVLYLVKGHGDGTFDPPKVKYGGNLDGAGSAVAAPPTWFYPYGKAVGGFWVPVDKFGLLAPYVGLSSAIFVTAVAVAIYVKRVKRRKEKH